MEEFAWSNGMTWLILLVKLFWFSGYPGQCEKMVKHVEIHLDNQY